MKYNDEWACRSEVGTEVLADLVSCTVLLSPDKRFKDTFYSHVDILFQYLVTEVNLCVC